jgi:hypothetical protein
VVEFTAPSHDGGIDLVATRVDAGGLARSKLYVQCKMDRSQPTSWRRSCGRTLKRFHACGSLVAAGLLVVDSEGRFDLTALLDRIWRAVDCLGVSFELDRSRGWPLRFGLIHRNCGKKMRYAAEPEQPF